MSKLPEKVPSYHPDVEDDLDDLDDVLDQFNAPQQPKDKLPGTSETVPQTQRNTVLGSAISQDTDTRNAASKDLDPNVDPDGGLPPGFAEELAAGMAALMSDLGQTADDDADSSDGFQKTIREAMDKLKSSEDTLKASSSNSVDPVKLLQDLRLDDLVDEGGQETQDIQGILESMMQQLMSKDILYEPLRDLDEKYPVYLRENGSKISAEEKARYTSQSIKVHELVALFEAPEYKDGDPTSSAEILKLMNEMQTYGSPPKELMGDLPPGLNLGEDGMPNLGEDCVVI